MFESLVSQSQKENLKKGSIVLKDAKCKQMVIDFQLKLFQTYGPILGIYGVPNLIEPLIWNCVMFIRHGFYKGGRFKFDIDLRSFPQKAPKIQFTFPVFHPLIDQKTGQVDMTWLLSDNWNYGKQNMLYNVFNDFKRVFVDRRKLDNKFSYNPSAAKLLENGMHLYIEKSLKSVDQSIEKWTQNRQNTALIINQYTFNELHQLSHHIDKVISTDGMSKNEKKQKILDFVLHDL